MVDPAEANVGPARTKLHSEILSRNSTITSEMTTEHILAVLIGEPDKPDLAMEARGIHIKRRGIPAKYASWVDGS